LSGTDSKHILTTLQILAAQNWIFVTATICFWYPYCPILS